MDFAYTEEQTQIRELAQQIFADQCGDEFQMNFSKARSTGGPAWSKPLWKTMADSGLLGTAIPETYGGSGFGMIELCQVLEQQGHSLAPVPLLPALAMAGMAICRFGNDAQKNRYLGKLASGELLLTVAVAEESMSRAMRSPCTATQQGAQWVLNGTRVAIPYAKDAAAIIVATSSSLFIVETAAKGLGLEFTNSGNHEPLYTVTFTNTPAEVLGSIEQHKEALQYLLDCGSIAACATMIGLCAESMRRTAQYTSERKQFETTIASFQNTTMKMADCYIDIEALRSAYLEGLWKLDAGRPCHAEIKVAKYWACSAGHRVTHTCQHLHGGIGADVEYPLHRYYLWFKQMDLTLGGGTKQLADLGELIAADNSINLIKNLA